MSSYISGQPSAFSLGLVGDVPAESKRRGFALRTKRCRTNARR
jgi:hypothetical protein